MKTYGTLDLRNMDCMDLMKDAPDNHWDLAIVDPPYGIKINMNMGRKAGQVKAHKEKNWDDAIPDDDYFREIMRVSAFQIIWGGNYFPLPLTGSWIFWDKEVPQGVSFADGELAWTSGDKALRKALIPYSGVIGSEGKIHPTQKPVALYRWLLQNYATSECKKCRGGGEMMGDDSNPHPCDACNATGTYKAKILDTHLGSGSIAIACHYLGFNLTGSELDADYYTAMMDRIDKETRQLEFDF